MSFKIGDKVVCVAENNSWNNWYYILGKRFKKFWDKSGPIKDKIYTVTNTGFYTPDKQDIIQIGNPNQWHSAHCFRKVEDNFADEVLEKIKEQIKQDNLILTP